MVFNSFSFIVFFIIVFSIYWMVTYEKRWILVLISSYFFYMSWNAKLVCLILITTIVSYIAALLIETTPYKKIRKIILYTTIIFCLSMLLFFKYINFLSKSVSDILNLFSIHTNPITLNILLPVGISFYTFQILGYVIDVYRGTTKAEHHFGYYATYISFFPQLVAGPIEKSKNLLPQLKSDHIFDYNQAVYGLILMTWGFFKKMCIADMLSIYVDNAYSQIYNSSSGFPFLFAIFGFTIQIYCDFSGYSDIAIGSAKLLGINLMKNFNCPYFACSIKEFWTRWHISLSTWFKEYIYIPLGGNRCSKLRNSMNLMITFLLSGLWHGANWTFVFWGGLHGLAQIIENFVLNKILNKKNKLVYCISVCFTFIFCSLSWTFFRANTVSDAIYVISHVFDGIENGASYFVNTINLGYYECFIMLFLVLILFIVDFVSLKFDLILELKKKPFYIRWCIYILLLMLIFLFARTGNNSFIYFQF